MASPIKRLQAKQPLKFEAVMLFGESLPKSSSGKFDHEEHSLSPEMAL